MASVPHGQPTADELNMLLPNKYAIIKADDLGFSDHLGNFLHLLGIHRRRAIPISIGAVGQKIAALLPGEIDLLRAYCRDPLVEIWNHSNTHRDLTTLSLQQQADDIAAAQVEIRKQLGVLPTVFGSPYNKYNADTFAAVSRLPELKTIYLPADNDIPAGAEAFILPRRTLVSPEDVTELERQCSLAAMSTRITRLGGGFLTLQFHPSSWNSIGFREYERCLDFLLESGYRFILASEIYDYQSAMLSSDDRKERLGKFTTTRGKMIFLNSIGIETLSDKQKENKFKLSGFFFNRFSCGIEHYASVFERIGFTETRRKVPSKAIDIGCGTGVWSVAYATLNVGCTVTALDKLPGCVDLCNSVSAAFEMQSSVMAFSGTEKEIHVDGEQPIYDEGWCINALQYMDPELFFSRLHSSLKSYSHFYVSFHTFDYYISSALAGLESNDLAVGASRLKTIVYSYAYRLGWCNRTTSCVKAFDKNEILECGKWNGFALVLERPMADPLIPRFAGRPIEVDAIFEQSAWRNDFKTEFLSADFAGRARILRKLIASWCPRIAIAILDELSTEDRAEFYDMRMVAERMVLPSAIFSECSDPLWLGLKELNRDAPRFSEAAEHFSRSASAKSAFLKTLCLLEQGGVQEINLLAGLDIFDLPADSVALLAINSLIHIKSGNVKGAISLLRKFENPDFHIVGEDLSKSNRPIYIS